MQILIRKFRLVAVVTIMVVGVCFGCSQKHIPTTSTNQSKTTSTSVNSTVITSLVVSSTTTTLSSTTNPIIWQRYANLGVKFHAVLTFSVNNSKISYPTDLAVPQVPSTWSGLSFSGKLPESGPGEDITDKVDGTVSTDGKVLVSLIYSRQILRTTNSGTSFSVSLSNVPLDVGNTSGTYGYSGTAIQGYISAISYADGTIVSGQIVASTTYVSSDWGSIQQPPILSITFGK